MSRDIKFRAWHTYHEFMFQVMEVTCDAQYASGFSRVVAYPFDDWNKSENERGEWANNAPRARTHYLHHEIDNLELMQFTGLKDKNGRDIYEGDIVRYGFFALNDVSKFGDEPWKHLPEDVEDSDITTEQMRYSVQWDFSQLASLQAHIFNNPDVLGVEIIGNIYEHPELIEGKS